MDSDRLTNRAGSRVGLHGQRRNARPAGGGGTLGALHNTLTAAYALTGNDHWPWSCRAASSCSGRRRSAVCLTTAGLKSSHRTAHRPPCTSGRIRRQRLPGARLARWGDQPGGRPSYSSLTRPGISYGGAGYPFLAGNPWCQRTTTGLNGSCASGCISWKRPGYAIRLQDSAGPGQPRPDLGRRQG